MSLFANNAPTYGGPPQPEHYHPALQGCKWAEPHEGAVSVKDERGQVLGIGSTQRVAADAALRVRQAASIQPEGYHDCLVGYRFASHPRSATDKLLWTAVLDPAGKTVAFAATKSDAALAAARHELRLRKASSLSLENFRRICTVVTVDVARGKTGKAKSGVPYLRLDTRDDPQDIARFQGLITRLLVDTHLGAPDFQTYESRMRWAAGVGEELLAANFFVEPTRAVRLGNGEWLVMRQPDAPPTRRCIELAHQEVVGACDTQLATQASTAAESQDEQDSPGEDEIPRDHDRMR